MLIYFFLFHFSIHNVCRHYLPFFRWPSGILWRICICTNNILRKLQSIPLKNKERNIIVDMRFLFNKNALQQSISYKFFLYHTFFSSPASCGSPFTNQRNSAYLLVYQLGMFNLNSASIVLNCTFISFKIQNQLI